VQNISHCAHQDGWYIHTGISDSEFETEGPIQVIHARSGVPHEIMGLMQGKVMDHAIVVMDSFALPVQGTETRVNAAGEANEYMVEYVQEGQKVGLRLLLFVLQVLMSYRQEE
jgi:hypothetical protein